MTCSKIGRNVRIIAPATKDPDESEIKGDVEISSLDIPLRCQSWDN